MNAHVWAAAVLAILVLDTTFFLLAALLRKNDLADVIWGPGFLVVVGTAWRFGAPERPADVRLVLAITLVGIWAIRLLCHVAARNLGHDEDARYAKWRAEWGQSWLWRSYLQVFLLQGLILLLVSSPLLWLVANQEVPLDGACYVGILVWLFGFAFEAIGDEQLRRFKNDPANRGKLMTNGLWSWSRHPNYFGEVVQWWGIFLFALPLPYGTLTVISPLLITFLILKVSGVPMLEEAMAKRPGAEEYRRQTSVFFPRPPRR
jgi:steroid 5-alpha reductase family enzyme